MQSFKSACSCPISLIASMIRSASASDAPVSTRMTRPSPATRNDFTTPRLGMAIRHGTIFTPSIGMSLRMLTMISSPGKIRRGFLDRRDDVAVAGAAAEIARDRFLDLLVGRPAALAEQTVSRHEHAGRAAAALHRVVFPERLLRRVQPLVLRQPFDRDDLVAVRLLGKNHARLHRPAVPQHRARAAAADHATYVRAGEPQSVAQKMREQRARFRLARVRFAVHYQSN